MTDAFKIAAKAALIAVVTVAVFALFSNIPLPAIDTSLITQAIGTGLAICFHWCPIMNILWPIVLFLLGLEIAEKAFHIAMIAIRWIFKVNE